MAHGGNNYSRRKRETEPNEPPPLPVGVVEAWADDCDLSWTKDTKSGELSYQLKSRTAAGEVAWMYVVRGRDNKKQRLYATVPQCALKCNKDIETAFRIALGRTK